MRTWPILLTCAGLLALCQVGSAQPGGAKKTTADKKDPVAKETASKKALLDKTDELTDKDKFDTKMTDRYAKVYEVDFEAGKSYRIDMTSRKVDSFLRLEDPDGKEEAADDDGGGFPNARIVYKAKRTATYRVIATTADDSPLSKKFNLKSTGAFHLVVREADRRDLLGMRIQTLRTQSPIERRKTLDEFADYLKKDANDLTAADGQLLFGAAMALENLPQKDGVAFAKQFADAVNDASDPQIKGLGKLLIGISRRLDLPGNTMELKGTLLDGKALDWSKYRGKLVLIDFWATWCGPCVVEMPRLKRMYEANKEKGFEIIGISLDHKADAPKKFMEDKGYEWPCVYEPDQQVQPMPDHYGILAIPATILVARDGKVIALNLRGAALERAVEQHLEKK
jgi:thiol-disulfide isomerase/thioredoxin